MSDAAAQAVGIFSEAKDLSVADRPAYLANICGNDETLRARVEALLRAHDRVGDFLEQTPARSTASNSVAPIIGEQPGDCVGRYKLLQQIGEGGCGVVFMAEQEQPVRRLVALKVIKPGMDTRNVIARFEAERQALALMDHPNIAKVLDAGATEAGRPYFVMELVRGVKITEYADQNRLTTDERLGLFVQVCQAVQHAHQKGIIHRDLKPSNILVTTGDDGRWLPKVIDFGIAKATANQRLTDKTVFTAFEMLIGTPAYMSPEQAALTSVDVDTRTDIYSLGVLLYELLTGSTPFDTEELLKAGLDEIRRVIREREPVRPSTKLNKLTGADLTTVAQRRKAEPPRLIRAVSGDLDWIVMKALEKDRTHRYATANDLALDVQRFLANETISARPPSRLYRFQKTVLRNKFLFLGIGIIAVLLVVSLIVVSAAFAGERQAHREAGKAHRQAELDKRKALSEAAKSRQVTRFLEDMLQGVEPSVALGRDTVMLNEILDKTVARLDVELTNEPAVQADLRQRLGITYQELGRYERSEAMLRQAGVIRNELFGAESEAASDVMFELGYVLYLQSKHAEAESLMRSALAARAQIFGPEHSKVAECYTKLCRIFWDQQRFQEAEVMGRRALAIDGNLLGREDPELGDSLVALGSALFGQGRFREAQELFRQAMDNWKRALGEDHPAVISAQLNLAAALAEQGNSTEAEALYRQGLATRRKLYGEQHPLFVDSLQGLSRCLMRKGEFAAAEPYLRQALAVERKLKNATNLNEILILRDLVNVLKRLNRVNEIGPLLVDALPATNELGAELADLLVERCDSFARSGHWEDARADATLILGRDSDDHQSYHRLAPLLVQAGDLVEYQKLCRSILEHFSGTTNAYVADRMAKDCLLLSSSGVDLQLVDALAETAVTVGKDQGAMPYFQCCKALVEYRQGHFASAIEWAQKSLDGQQFIYAQAEAYPVLAMAHHQLKQHDQAKAALAKGTELVQSKLPPMGSDDLGIDWQGWIFAQALMHEAASLIQPAAAAESNRGKP